MTGSLLLAKGGPVVWILLGYSLLAVTVAIERAIYFLWLGRPGAGLEALLAQRLSGGALLDAVRRLRGPEAVVVAAIVEAGLAGVRDLQAVASRVGSQQLQAMERGFRTLGVLGNTAPLLGLFGTITGMIKAFMVIEQAGGRVDAQALAGGIWEAMITTGVGLAVAIPVLLVLHVLEGMADRRALAMRSYASQVLERWPHEGAGEESQAVVHGAGVMHAV